LFSLVPSPGVSVKVWIVSHGRLAKKKITGLLLTKKRFGQWGRTKAQVLLVKPANEKFTHPYPAHTASQPQPSYSTREKETHHVHAPRSPAVGGPAPSAPPQEPPPLQLPSNTSASALHQHHGHRLSTTTPALQELRRCQIPPPLLPKPQVHHPAMFLVRSSRYKAHFLWIENLLRPSSASR
jgi:hypothetical protein